MIGKVLTKIFGSKNERVIKKLKPIIDKINSLEAGAQALDDDALRAKTGEFKERLTHGATLDDLLP